MIMIEPPPTGTYYVIQVKSESGEWMDTTADRIEGHFFPLIGNWRRRHPNHEFQLVERTVTDLVVPEGPIELD